MKFRDVYHLRKISPLTFQRSRSKFRSKPLYRKYSTCSWLWFKIACFHQIWQSGRSKFGMKYDSFDEIQEGGGGLRSLSAC